LAYISQFCTTIMHVKGSENAVADAFSRLCCITMPTVIKLSQIEEEQASDPELVHLLKGTTSLKLQRVRFDDNISLYCDVIRTDLEKITHPHPKNLRFLRSFLGMVGW